MAPSMEIPERVRPADDNGYFGGPGRTSCFVFLWCVDEDVPDWEER